MVGSVHKYVLDDLLVEGLTSYATQITSIMQTRTQKYTYYVLFLFLLWLLFFCFFSINFQNNRWNSLPFPFGSEFPWDSTGQEEIYTFTQYPLFYYHSSFLSLWILCFKILHFYFLILVKYFADYSQSNATLNAVLAYMPSTPMWAYHGSAKRFSFLFFSFFV
jgi:hypothetical protein